MGVTLGIRRITIIGQIDDDSFEKFCTELTVFEEESSSRVELELCSEGGYVYNALAFIGRMRRSPCDIYVIGYGYVASAATLILAAGTKRFLSEEAWVMVHEDSLKMKGTVSESRNELNQIERQERQWNELMAEYCSGAAQFWANMKRDTYLSSSDCLRLGIIDKII